MYVLLEEGEMILQTDEFYRPSDNTWIPLKNITIPYKNWYLPVRRKVIVSNSITFKDHETLTIIKPIHLE